MLNEGHARVLIVLADVLNATLKPLRGLRASCIEALSPYFTIKALSSHLTILNLQLIQDLATELSNAR